MIVFKKKNQSKSKSDRPKGARTFWQKGFWSVGAMGDNVMANSHGYLAMQIYNVALGVNPAFLGLAMLYQKQRNVDKAIVLLNNGLEQNPENKDLNICMGVCLMNKEKFDTALTFFEKFKEHPETGHYINICHQKLSAQKI